MSAARSRWVCCALAFAALLGLAAPPRAEAHKPSDSYLALAPVDARVQVRWDVALRDLDAALGLDADDDGKLTWGEVRRRQSDIDALLLSSLTFSNGNETCGAPRSADAGTLRHALAIHSDGAYAVLQFEFLCREYVDRLQVDYRLFAELDPTHRGIVSVSSAGGGAQAAVLGPDRPSLRFTVGSGSAAATLLRFLAEGVRHIWEGYDHLLFLLTLLLPSVLVPAGASGNGPRWLGAPRFTPALLDVVRIVTAFTVAHSITLALTVLDLVDLPSRGIESAIAATVLLSAVNNLYPVLHRNRWAAAFGFGLIHGFGFGQALKEQALPPDGVFASLLGFNLGVELGQLAVVAAFVPLAFWARHTLFYRRALLLGGSSVAAVIASIWLVERVLDVGLISR